MSFQLLITCSDAEKTCYSKPRVASMARFCRRRDTPDWGIYVGHLLGVVPSERPTVGP